MNEDEIETAYRIVAITDLENNILENMGYFENQGHVKIRAF